MRMDVNKGNADFTTVSDTLHGEKSNKKKEIDLAR
jgi:hypothetical protein